MWSRREIRVVAGNTWPRDREWCEQNGVDEAVPGQFRRARWSKGEENGEGGGGEGRRRGGKGGGTGRRGRGRKRETAVSRGGGRGGSPRDPAGESA